jgi:putative sigma-54 modulation protein
MHFEVIGRNFQVDDAVRRHVEQKLQKLSRFLDEPVEARLTLVEEKHRHIAELHLSHRAGILQATEETSGEMSDAVNLLLDKIEEQARRSHEKLVDRRRRGDRPQPEDDNQGLGAPEL